MFRTVIAAIFIACSFDASAQTIGSPNTSIVVNLAATGITIPANFIGFSGEVGDFVGGAYQGASGANGSLASLIGLLGTHGVVRLGGGSSDAGTAPTITAGMSTNLNTFLGALGASWTLIYGLDLNANDTTTAATTASNIATAVGLANVTFQFGNEPAGYITSANYITRWNAYYTAVIASVPGAHVSMVDDVINTTWGSVPTVAAALTPGIAGMSLITQHFYSFCRNVFPTPTPLTLIRSVAADAYSGGIVNIGAGYLRNTGAFGSVQQRMSETNSICNSGQTGMSDTLMGATWFMNLAMILAANGWAGMNVHNASLLGGTAFYNPFVYVSADTKFTAGPIFYGMYLISKIQGQQIVAASVAGGDVRALATKGGGGNANIVVANNDVRNAVTVTPAQSSAWTTANVLQVKGNAGCTEANPTVGGAVIGESGAWSGTSFSLSNGQSFSLGPCESALIQIQP